MVTMKAGTRKFRGQITVQPADCRADHQVLRMATIQFMPYVRGTRWPSPGQRSHRRHRQIDAAGDRRVDGSVVADADQTHRPQHVGQVVHLESGPRSAGRPSSPSSTPNRRSSTRCSLSGDFVFIAPPSTMPDAAQDFFLCLHAFGKFLDDPTLAQHDDAIGQARQLGEVRGNDQDRHPFPGEAVDGRTSPPRDIYPDRRLIDDPAA